MRLGDSGWFSLHPGEFFLLWTGLGLGELPPALGVASVGRTSAARARLRDSADRSLQERGLGTVGEPDRDVAALLEALAASTVRADLEIVTEGGTFRAVGGSGPYGHVTAGFVEDELEIKIGPVSEYTLVSTMFGAVDPLPAGVGSPGNVPVEDYLRACRAGEHGGADVFLDVLRGAGARPVEANTFLRAIRDARSAGRFGVGVDDGAGRWSRASSTVNWVDTAAGRYALRRKDGWVTVTPVDPQRLLGMAEELVGEVAPGRL